MKKFFNLSPVFPLVLCLLIMSCEEGAEGNEPQPDPGATSDTTATDVTTDEAVSPIIGVWKYKSAEFEAQINGHDLLDYLMEKYEISEDEANEMLEALKEKHEYANILQFIAMSSIEFKSDGSFTASSPAGNESGAYSLDNDELTITYDGKSQPISVVSLTENEIELHASGEFEEDVDGDENEDNLSVAVSLVLEK